MLRCVAGRDFVLEQWKKDREKSEDRAQDKADIRCLNSEGSGTTRRGRFLNKVETEVECLKRVESKTKRRNKESRDYIFRRHGILDVLY